MKKNLFALLLICMAIPLMAQESQTTYNFLRLPTSAHAAALGGDNITLIEDDEALGLALYRQRQEPVLGLHELYVGLAGGQCRL